MPRRFADASVFVHSYLRPTRELKPHEVTLKRSARSIVTRIQRGEPVVLSTVHLAEVANLLEDWMPLGDAQAVARTLCTKDAIEILPVEKRDLVEALAIGAESGLGTTDALAILLMRRHGVAEIYSFDRDFDRREGIRRVSR